MVQEKKGDISMEEEEMTHEDQEKKEANEDEEKMEEEETSGRKKKEEDNEDENMEKGEDEETADVSILEPVEGEEEGGEEPDIQTEEHLLMDDEVMDSEEILRNFVSSEHECQSFPDLTIQSPKDNMSDDDELNQTQNSQANAYDPYSSEIFNESCYYSTKPNDGSTLNYQDESSEHLQTSSITDPHDDPILEAEEQEVEELEQEVEVSADSEVLVVGEVKMKEKEQESNVEEGGSKDLGGPSVASKDYRPEYKEVIKNRCNYDPGRRTVEKEIKWIKLL